MNLNAHKVLLKDCQAPKHSFVTYIPSFCEVIFTDIKLALELWRFTATNATKHKAVSFTV